MRILAVLLCLWAPAALAEAQFIGAYQWSFDDPNFGGLSGVAITDNGTRIMAMSDRAHVFTGTVKRDGDQITGIGDVQASGLRDEHDRPLRQWLSDSEGLALAPDGRFYVSFEGQTQIRAYAGPDAPGIPLPTHPDFAGMQKNASLESLTIGPDGALYTLPERSGRADWPFQVYRYSDGWTTPFSIPRRGSFLPTEADVGPDGFLYILERDFYGVGFRSRVRRFDLTGGNEVEILESGIGQFGNLEGLSVWRDETGAIRLTMISDNNFLEIQRTDIVEYRLTD